jgi:hypothetical protein
MNFKNNERNLNLSYPLEKKLTSKEMNANKTDLLTLII